MTGAFRQEIVLGIIVVFNFLVASYVLMRNPRSSAHQSFFVFVNGGALWGMGVLFLYLTKEFAFSKLVFLGGYIMVGGLLMLAYAFPDAPPIRKKLWLSLIPLGFFILTTPFNIFVKGLIVRENGGIEPVNGPFIPFLVAAMAVYVAAALYMFIKKYRALSGLPRLQMQYLFLGTAIFIVAVFFFNIFLPSVGIAKLNLLGPAFSIIFVASTAYTIARHRLLDLRLIVVRAFSFLIFLGFLAGLYAVTLFFVLQKITPFAINPVLFANMLFFTVAAMLTFQPLQEIIRKTTQKLFFQNAYDSDELLSRLTHIMTSSIDLKPMLGQVLEVLMKEMKIGKAAVLVIDNHAIVDMQGVGYDRRGYVSPDLEILLHRNRGRDEVWVYDELQDPQLKNLFEKLDIAVAIPMKVDNNEVALLILGRKLSGEIYYYREIELLKVFASEAGIAIQNAEAYLKIKQFNEELERKVEERTKELGVSQERELAKAKDIAKLRDEFVFIAVHELRAPVAIIKGFTELAAEATQGTPASIKDYLRSITSASGQLNQLIDDILEIARSESESVKVPVESIDITPVIESTVADFSPVAAERHIHLEFKKEAFRPNVLANGKKLKEVVSNLISNAIKYNRPNGSVRVRTFTKDRDFVLECEDTGYGIPQRDQEKIFQKFFRSQNKETREVKGTGLGLFITRMLIEKMGGEVQFSSTEGKGTTFSIHLPIAQNKTEVTVFSE